MKRAVKWGRPVRVFCVRWAGIGGLAGLLGAAGCQTPQANPQAADGPIKATVREDFELTEPSAAWTFRTPALWRIATEDERNLLQMAIPPKRPMMPGVRRPQEFAIYNKYQFRSFSLTCRIRVDDDPANTARDACVIFGRKDDTHFYYAHLGSTAGGTHNTLMRVDGDKRQSLIPAGTQRPAAMPDRAWHKVDILRDVTAGTIKVYVDAFEPNLRLRLRKLRPWQRSDLLEAQRTSGSSGHREGLDTWCPDRSILSSLSTKRCTSSKLKPVPHSGQRGCVSPRSGY
jgi:hypothetical protein